MLHRCFLYHFMLVLPQFLAKIEKNLPIFCNFFSLCINDLRKSYKNNCSKVLTISENVVSLHRCLKLNKTTNQNQNQNNNNNKKQRENENEQKANNRKD